MNPHHSLTMHIRDALNANANRTTSSLRSIQKCLNHVFLLVQLKSYRVGKNLMQRRLRGLTTWRDMLENALRGTLKLANNKVEQLYKVSHPCLDDHQFKKEEFESVGDLSEVCSQIVLKCLYLARNGRPDILWSVNNFARAVTKWTQACDKRLARLISYIGNTAQHCPLSLFQDSDFAGDFEDSNRNQPREESYVFVEAEHLSPSVGCARNRRQYPTVPQNLKAFRWMLDCEWMDFLLSTCGTW